MERKQLLLRLKAYLSSPAENSSELKDLEVIFLGTSKVQGCSCKSKLIRDRLQTYYNNHKQELDNEY